jgi:Zn-dependent peptidase ImmA (M78 family)/transcriptional regulator with XRE-family HTH domain
LSRDFDRTRLTLARHLAGLTKRDLASKLGVSAPAVTQYESGQATPRPAVLAQLSLVLGCPPEYFIRSPGRRQPKTEARSFFRSLRATRQHERDRAEALVEHVADLVALIEEDLALPELQLPHATDVDVHTGRRELEAAAALVRRQWNLPPGPVGHVVRELEAHGILVCRLGSGPSRVDAFSRWLDDRPVVVLWASKTDKARSRFDASHELGHLVMHPDPEPANPLLERQAHAFAAGFLMPAEQIEEDLPRRPPRPGDWDELFETRRRWGVSIAALLKRSRELGTLSESGFRRAMVRLSERGLRRGEGDDLGPPETPRLLSEAVSAVAQARKQTWDQLADDLRLSPRHLMELVEPAERSEALDPAPNRRLRAV